MFHAAHIIERLSLNHRQAPSMLDCLVRQRWAAHLVRGTRQHRQGLVGLAAPGLRWAQGHGKPYQPRGDALTGKLRARGW
jgi:hypothetical protein